MESSKDKNYKPKKNCKYCYGRGYIGHDVVHENKRVGCACVLKQFYKDKKKL